MDGHGFVTVETDPDDGSSLGRVPALDAPVAPVAERRDDGRDRRRSVKRRTLGNWAPAVGRPDPITVLEQQNATRVPELVPLRMTRMAASPFAYLRGAAAMMALDLATLPTTGIDVQLCADAHLSNFGVFATPERQMAFDLNDFDETLPGPFEWDVARLVASVFVAGRGNGFDRDQCRAAARSASAAYRGWMHRFADQTHLDTWYARLRADDLVGLTAPSDRRTVSRALEAARGKDHLRALAKLTTIASGRRRIVEDPPLLVRVTDEGLRAAFPAMIDGYRATLRSDHLALFDRYRLVDVARKVVGVGSVGTRCWVALFQGPNGGPLFLQVKQAGPPAPEVAGRPNPYDHQGRRVVEGQRLLQASSDILLGWTGRPDGTHYYVRQLWDAKGSADVESMNPMLLSAYAGVCGWALARAHARTGDAVRVAGYLGRSTIFDESVTAFAEAYADQTERDHAALAEAVRTGRVPTIQPVG